MDPIQERYFIFRDWCEAMPEGLYWLIFRTMMLLGFPTLLCGYAFKSGSRSTVVQVFCLTVGVLAAMIIPFAHPPWQPDVKAFAVVFATLVDLVAPALLPFYLTPRYGTQKRIRTALYVGLAVLFLVGIL